MNATADTTSTLSKINADKSCFDWINERVTFSETDFINKKNKFHVNSVNTMESSLTRHSSKFVLCERRLKRLFVRYIGAQICVSIKMYKL